MALSASCYMARCKATRQATEPLTVYMLYGYVTVHLVVDKPQL